APCAAPRAVAARAAGHEPALVVGRAHPRPVPLGRQGRVGGHAARPGPAPRPGPPPPPRPAGRRSGIPPLPPGDRGRSPPLPHGPPVVPDPGRDPPGQPAAAGGLLLTGVRHLRGAAAVLRRPGGAGRRPPEGVERPRRPPRRR